MRYSLMACAICAVTALVGCGSGRPTVSGVVKLDGQPLDGGTIFFTPEKGDSPTSSAVIGKDGTYHLEASPTKMKVVISCSKVTGKRKRYPDMPDSPEVDINEEVLPRRYSDEKKTELTYTVVPGANQKDWDLTSDKK
jgi:hypothetical protein